MPRRSQNTIPDGDGLPKETNPPESNPNSLGNVADNTGKLTREQLKAKFRNIIVGQTKRRFNPYTSTALPQDYTYKDAIDRRMVRNPRGLEAAINVQEFMRSDRRMLPKSDNALDTIDKFTQPYTLDYLARLQNAAEFDGVIKKGVRVKSWYVFAGGVNNLRHRMQIQSMEEFETQQEELAFLNEMFPDKDAQKATKKYVDNVCIDSGIFGTMREIYELSVYFGRSAAVKIFANMEAIKERRWDETKQYFEKTPILFQPLSPMLMGNVTVDQRTWLSTYLWYNDSIFGLGTDGKPKPGGWLSRERMIYMARRDIHLLPNKLRYGLSDLSPLLPISELCRQLYSDVLGEAVANLILPSLFLVFDSLDEDSMQEIIDRYQQGGIMGRNKDVSVEPIDFDVNLPAIIDLLKSLQRLTYSYLEIPYLFGGDEGEFNRSVAETVTDVWQKTVLEPEREIVQDVLDGQFYGPLVSDYMEKYYNDKQYDWNTERLRFVLKFPKIDFSNVVDKAQGLSYLIDRNVLSVRQAQDMFEIEPWTPEQGEAMTKLQKLVANDPALQEKLLAYAQQLRQTATTTTQAQQDPTTEQETPSTGISLAINKQKADMMEDMANNRI